jgi:exodeoxyribonuclease VII small subunit
MIQVIPAERKAREPGSMTTDLYSTLKSVFIGSGSRSPDLNPGRLAGMTAPRICAYKAGEVAPELGNEPMADNADVPQLSFEKALAELESIVQKLERGDVALEESVAIYERGEALKRRCEELLRQAEARVEKITLDSSGKPTGTEPLDVG